MANDALDVNNIQNNLGLFLRAFLMKTVEGNFTPWV